MYGYHATCLAEPFERINAWSNSPRNVRVGRLQARSKFKLSVGGGVSFGALILTGDWRGTRKKKVREKVDIGA